MLKQLKKFFYELYFCILFIGYTVYGTIVMNKALKIRENVSEEECQEFIRPRAVNFFKRCFKWLFLNVSIEGKENITEDKYMIVANHQSYLDVPLIAGFVDESVYFIAKEELKKLPLFGKGITLLGLFIDREDPRKAVVSIRKIIEMIKSGKRVLLFPEGTRSTDGNLLPFKKGTMRIPMMAKAKILPIAIIGTELSWPKGRIFPQRSNIKVKILPIVDSTEYKTEEELSELIMSMISEARISN